MAGRIYASLRSGCGCVRSGNEDCWYLNGESPALERMNEEAARHGAFPDDGSLFAVCDGVGGARKGELASWTAVSGMADLQQRLLSAGDLSRTVQDWTHETNVRVDDATRGGGCTLAMVYIRQGKAFVGHIGDSRVYRLRDGRLERVTHDHSKVQMLMDAGLITPEEAAVHPQRHMILRSLGMNEDDGPCICELNKPMTLQPGDRYLICSDGVTDMIPEPQLAELLGLPGDPDSSAEAIYRAALQAGGVDNTTLIVLEYREDGAPAPEDINDETILPGMFDDTDDDGSTVLPGDVPGGSAGMPGGPAAEPFTAPVRHEQPSVSEADFAPRRKSPLLPILLAVILCIALAAGAWFTGIIPHPPVPTPTPTVTPTPTPAPTPTSTLEPTEEATGDPAAKSPTESASVAIVQFSREKNSITVHLQELDLKGDYKLYYRKVGDTDWIEYTDPITNGAAVIADLSSGTWYEFKVVKTVSGESQDMGKVQTLPSPEPTPTPLFQGQQG